MDDRKKITKKRKFSEFKRGLENETKVVGTKPSDKSAKQKGKTKVPQKTVEEVKVQPVNRRSQKLLTENQTSRSLAEVQKPIQSIKRIRRNFEESKKSDDVVMKEEIKVDKKSTKSRGRASSKDLSKEVKSNKEVKL